MMWGIQVKVCDEWQWMRPIGQPPYAWPDRNYAVRMMEMSYPDCIEGKDVRVAEYNL